MDVDRRTVMKGMATGGALLATGMPRWLIAGDHAGHVTRPCVLVLGGSTRDHSFADGIQRTASAVGIPALPTVSLAARDLDATARLLRDRPSTRLVGIMDDGAYAIFHESVRAAGARLLCLGRHAGGLRSRHGILTTPAFAGAGAMLAHAFSVAGCSALVTESPLGTSGHGLAAIGLDGRAAAVGSVAAHDADPRGWADTLAHALLFIALGAEPTTPLYRSSGPGWQCRHSRDRVDSDDACVTFVIDV